MAVDSVAQPGGERSDFKSRRGLSARFMDHTRGARLRGRRRTDTLGFRFFGLLLLSISAALGLLFAVGLGAVIAATTVELPPVTELSSQFSFRTTQILDRNGKLLYELNNPDKGRSLPVPLSEVSPSLIDATIATEDKDFYTNMGVDPLAILRAAIWNVTTGELSQGASTITQQLAKNELIATESRDDKSWTRKLQEAILAVRMSERYTKDEILEMYLNSVYYGHLSYGVEAAAQTFFGKHARDLNLAEASLLAGLPQAPTQYDPFVNLEAAKARQAHVLNRMVAEGYITREDADAALVAPLRLRSPDEVPFRAPHFVTYVRELLEQKYGPELVYKGGLRVTTTLDLDKYDLAMAAVRTNLERLKRQDANNAALVAVDPGTGQIVVMLGSRDFFDKSIHGEVNMATSPRPPGSTIKPLEYALAFSKGWGPQTVVTDEPTRFPNRFEWQPDYMPDNYDHKFDGPMTIRYALGNSKNIPAVKALMYVGIPDFLRFLSDMDIEPPGAEEFGPALGLGGAPISPLQMAAAYSVFASGGIYRKPVAILRVEDWQGNVLEEWHPTEGRQVLGATQAYMITSILSDNWIRTPLQGPNSVLKLSRPAAAKTGSTDSYRDSWLVGYTPDLVTAVWVGNTDNRPMREVLGSMGAGRIWHTFMEDVHASLPVRDFTPPPGVREYRLCRSTGLPATPACTEVLQEVYPTTYTPAEFAIVPGLEDIAANRTASIRARQGGVLGQTVSPDGLPMQPRESNRPW